MTMTAIRFCVRKFEEKNYKSNKGVGNHILIPYKWGTEKLTQRNEAITTISLHTWWEKQRTVMKMTEIRFCLKKWKKGTNFMHGTIERIYIFSILFNIILIVLSYFQFLCVVKFTNI